MGNYNKMYKITYLPESLKIDAKLIKKASDKNLNTADILNQLSQFFKCRHYHELQSNYYKHIFNNTMHISDLNEKDYKSFVLAYEQYIKKNFNVELKSSIYKEKLPFDNHLQEFSTLIQYLKNDSIYLKNIVLNFKNKNNKNNQYNIIYSLKRRKKIDLEKFVNLSNKASKFFIHDILIGLEKDISYDILYSNIIELSKFLDLFMKQSFTFRLPTKSLSDKDKIDNISRHKRVSFVFQEYDNLFREHFFNLALQGRGLKMNLILLDKDYKLENNIPFKNFYN